MGAKEPRKEKKNTEGVYIQGVKPFSELLWMVDGVQSSSTLLTELS